MNLFTQNFPNLMSLYKRNRAYKVFRHVSKQTSTKTGHFIILGKNSEDSSKGHNGILKENKEQIFVDFSQEMIILKSVE